MINNNESPNKPYPYTSFYWVDKVYEKIQKPPISVGHIISEDEVIKYMAQGRKFKIRLAGICSKNKDNNNENPK